MWRLTFKFSADDLQTLREGRSGAVVRELASHKCGPLSIPGVDAVIMWVKFVIASLPCSERFFSGCSGFLPLLKNKPHGHVSTSSYVVRAPWINSLYVYKLRFYLCWEDC